MAVTISPQGAPSPELRVLQSEAASIEARLSLGESSISAASAVDSLDTRVSTEASTRAAGDSSLTVLASTNAATASTASSSLTVLASTNKSLASAADSSLTALISSIQSSTNARMSTGGI